ncbi:hypothetical protein [Vibrio sp. 10N.239.312.D08]|uniref:hypothetical protein n=1 Tax=Vibrio sp. 10N.239.312.D08 TaxID=3229978 RepID=UPI00354AEBE2
MRLPNLREFSLFFLLMAPAAIDLWFVIMHNTILKWPVMVYLCGFVFFSWIKSLLSMFLLNGGFFILVVNLPTPFELAMTKQWYTPEFELALIFASLVTLGVFAMTVESENGYNK